MAEMRRSFHNVKSLLGKLDRSIDEARSKRLGDPTPSDDTPESGDRDGLETVIGRSEVGGGSDSGVGESGRSAESPAPAPAARPPASPRRSVYGRAKPLNRTDGPAAMGQWSN